MLAFSAQTPAHSPVCRGRLDPPTEQTSSPLCLWGTQAAELTRPTGPGASEPQALGQPLPRTGNTLLTSSRKAVLASRHGALPGAARRVTLVFRQRCVGSPPAQGPSRCWTDTASAGFGANTSEVLVTRSGSGSRVGAVSTNPRTEPHLLCEPRGRPVLSARRPPSAASLGSSALPTVPPSATRRPSAAGTTAASWSLDLQIRKRTGGPGSPHFLRTCFRPPSPARSQD